MDELRAFDQRAEDEFEAQDAGTTFVLAEGGWETSEYVDPDDDWSLQRDGSYLSPNGTLRTWPLMGSEPE